MLETVDLLRQDRRAGPEKCSENCSREASPCSPVPRTVASSRGMLSPGPSTSWKTSPFTGSNVSFVTLSSIRTSSYTPGQYRRRP